jgi:hypothetical protein
VRAKQARSLLQKGKKDRIKKLIGKCENCSLDHGSILAVHHIIPVSEHPDNPNAPENLIVLCPNCHAHAHTGGISHATQVLSVSIRSPEVVAEMERILRVPPREQGVNTNEYSFSWNSLNYYRMGGRPPFRHPLKAAL